MSEPIKRVVTVTCRACKYYPDQTKCPVCKGTGKVVLK